ncbi:hypothetical protein QEH59_04685 [Coraliomargarita sp. SDUM461004]|uniref:Uncharacterized protein n=1 Tax=Thalassobacterium sedimentorum TaxID=3041258 RepID=A0ABU1AFV1_9BACT|nr:hypothetical protein [Coraliomargarita sp. SDUM461004]MDQ8193706.1 hypothetical protein [Coraliomargarita sp. SDUM461004]
MKSHISISLAVGLYCSSLHAETLEDYAPLLQNSPFLSQAFKLRLEKSDAKGIKNYSFNGYTKIENEWEICLIHKKENIATWLKINEQLEGYTLTSFNPKLNTLTFEKDSITTVLPMEMPK